MTRKGADSESDRSHPRSSAKSAEKFSGPIRIVGQGLAGTALAWECERAGIEFEIVDRGLGGAASSAAAGVINPVTGQRFVKSWRIEEMLPLALEFYRDVERRLGASLLEPLRGWRVFRNEVEATRYATKHASGELAPYDRGAVATESLAPWCSAAHGGAEFGEVWRLDVARYLTASRERWNAAGRLPESEFVDDGSDALTILCTGAALHGDRRLPATLRLRCAHGEIVELRDARVPVATMINARHWFFPITGEDGRVLGGASYRVGGEGSMSDGADELARAAAEVLRVPGTVENVRSGVRLIAEDKLPLAGWLDAERRVGVCTALGSKGTLFAPWLARMWGAQLREGTEFASEVAVQRGYDAPRSRSNL